MTSRITLIGLSTLCATSVALADPVADREAAGRLYAAGAWSEAASAYRTLADANPDFGAYAYFLGVSLAHDGRCAEATPTLERALALGAAGGRPSVRRAHVELAACAAERGDPDAAFSYLRMARARFGFSDFAALAQDARFASLRTDARFEQLAGALDRNAIGRTVGWRGDLEAYVDLLQTRHPNPFHAGAEIAWRHAVAALYDDIPTLGDVEIVGRFMRLTGLIGDGHTTIIPPLEGPSAFRLLPIWPYAFGDDWYIAAAAPDYADIVGARIVAVNGVPMAQVYEQIAAMTPHDNTETPRWIAATALQFVEVAALAAHASDVDHVVLEIETPDGARRTVSLPGGPIDRDPTTRWAPDGWPSMSDGAARPQWLAHAGEPFFTEEPDRHGVLFVQLNQIADGDAMTFAEFTDNLSARLAQPRVRTLVLDLRHNNGGNGALNWRLVRAVVRAQNLDHPNGIYIIVGRRTFSAAMNLASMFETHTNAIFVGEPTGSRPNFYGEDTPFTLPYSGLSGSISSAWFQGGETSDDLRPWIAPDLPAPLTIADLRAGRDPSMAAIAAHMSEAR